MSRTSLPPSAVNGFDASDMGDRALFDTLLTEAPFGFAFFGTDLCFQRVNHTLAALDGRPVEDHIGRRPGELLDAELADPIEAALRVVVEQDRTLTDREFSVEAPPGSGEHRYWLSNWVPAHADDGRLLGVAVLAVEVTDTRRSEEELRRSWERYRSLAQASAQVVWVASPEGKIHEDSREWHAITGQTFEEYGGDGWLDAVHPEDRAQVEQAWRRALASGSTFECDYRLRIHSGQYRNYSSRAVPIVRDGTIVEWVGASTDVTATRDSEEMRERLNQQLSSAALRTARLQQVTSMLAEALTVDDVARTIVEVGGNAIGADHTAVAIYDKRRERLRIVNDDAPELPGPDASSLSLDTQDVLSYAVRQRDALLATSPDDLREQLPGAEIEEFLAHTDECAWVGLPLLTSGDPIGALRFSFARPRTITDEERTFLQAVAGQCALAVERATFYEREHRTAETLQHSLLPGQLPQPPGLVLAPRYLPAGSGLRVGGDWYDAFEVPDGRLAVVVGDVMGKGVGAAAGMGRVRSALRALALSDPQPSAVLTGLDSLFAATEAEEQMTTVLYSLLDPQTGDVLVGNAGHPPPLVLSPGRRPRFAPSESGRPLGAPLMGGGGGGREQQHYRLSLGETAVAFSDGLVENRAGRSVHEGLEELVTVASEAACDVASDPHALLDYLYSRMLAGYAQDDDVTLLAIHVHPEDA